MMVIDDIDGEKVSGPTDECLSSSLSIVYLKL